jgi:hypothetical protein
VIAELTTEKVPRWVQMIRPTERGYPGQCAGTVRRVYHCKSATLIQTARWHGWQRYPQPHNVTGNMEPEDVSVRLIASSSLICTAPRFAVAVCRLLRHAAIQTQAYRHSVSTHDLNCDPTPAATQHHTLEVTYSVSFQCKLASRTATVLLQSQTGSITDYEPGN